MLLIVIIKGSYYTMLNIGQVVYDYTNKGVIIFAGFGMFQNQKTGKCHSESGFILKDGTFIHLKSPKGKNTKIPFKYTNLIMDGKPFAGSFITKCQCNEHFFGIINGNDAEVKIWAKETIEETETLINKHGLNKTEEKHDGKEYPRYHIGKIIKYKPKTTISTPSTHSRNRNKSENISLKKK